MNKELDVYERLILEEEKNIVYYEGKIQESKLKIKSFQLSKKEKNL